MPDYVCHAFPDDAYVTDQFFVGLISVAVALPVDLFLQRAFEIANEVEGAPESWLMFSGVWRLLLGKHAHSHWHFTRNRPKDLTMFVVRGEDPSMLEALAWRLEESPLRPLMRVVALAYDAEAWAELPGMLLAALLWLPRKLRWLVLRLRGKLPEEGEEDDGSDSSSEVSEATAARRDRLRKRLYASAGLLGVYVVWAIFSWFIFVCTAPACMHACVVTPCILTRATPFRRHAHLHQPGPGCGARICEHLGNWLRA